MIPNLYRLWHVWSPATGSGMTMFTADPTTGRTVHAAVDFRPRRSYR